MLVSISTDVLYSSSAFKRTGVRSIFRIPRVNWRNQIVLVCHGLCEALCSCSILVYRWLLTVNTPQCTSSRSAYQGISYCFCYLWYPLKISTIITINRKLRICNQCTFLFYKSVALVCFPVFSRKTEREVINRKTNAE